MEYSIPDMHILVKFTSYEHAKSFRSGKLYMNTLDYFWTHGFESQKDILEGVTSSTAPDNFVRLGELHEYQLTDLQFQAEGYRYCNVFCMSRIDIQPAMSLGKREAFNIETPSHMEKFGEFAIIIKNKSEFQRRLNKAVNSYKFLCGSVNYHQMKNDGVLRNNPHIVLKSSESLDVDIRGIKDSKKWDAFDKDQKYNDQKEWRICLFRNEKSIAAYTLDIGDISDITYMIKTSKLKKEVDNLEKVFKYCSSDDSFYGNISRRELREAFYKLGDYKAYLITTIG